MNLILPLFFIFVSSITAQSDGNNACLAILKDGIYDHYSTKTSSAEAQSKISSFCTHQSSSHQASKSSSSLNTIFGFNAGYAYSQSQITALASMMCGSPAVSGSSQTSLSIASQIVDPTILSAYQDCLNQDSAGLVIETNLRPDQGQVTIQLRYIPQLAGLTYMTVESIDISPPEAWECEGPLWDSANNVTLSTETIAMACTRNVSNDPFIFISQSVYSGSSTITIFTNVGSITKVFAPIYAEASASIPSYDGAGLGSLLAMEQQLSSTIEEVHTSGTNSQNQLTSLQAEFNSRVPTACNIPIYQWLVYGSSVRSNVLYGQNPGGGYTNGGVAFYGCSS